MHCSKPSARWLEHKWLSKGLHNPEKHTTGAQDILVQGSLGHHFHLFLKQELRVQEDAQIVQNLECWSAIPLRVSDGIPPDIACPNSHSYSDVSELSLILFLTTKSTQSPDAGSASWLCSLVNKGSWCTAWYHLHSDNIWSQNGQSPHQWFPVDVKQKLANY